LIYCTPVVKDFLLAHIEHATYVDDGVSPTMLRNLDECIEGLYRLLLTDNASVGLRGTDYRSYDGCILFVTLRPFAHRREMVQAANRVGRGGDKCRRVAVGDFALVDHLASCSYKRKLISYLDSAKAVP